MIDASKLLAAAIETAQSEAAENNPDSPSRQSAIANSPVYPSKRLAVKDGLYVVVGPAKGDAA